MRTLATGVSVALLISVGLAAQDTVAVARAAHKLKSSARAVGAVALADIAFELERAGRAEDWPALSIHSHALVPAFDDPRTIAGQGTVAREVVAQLGHAPDGMVIPVGASRDEQELLLIVKTADGRIERRSVLPVRFVPLVPGK